MENFKKILIISFMILAVSWILFNPYIHYSISEFISNFSALTNDFCRNIGLNYRFSSDDILNLLRFFEYFIFGILSAFLHKNFFRKIWSNLANPLFLGLLVSTLEGYFRSFSCYVCAPKVGLIMVSFLEFCVGLLIVLILRIPKNKKVFSSRYKKNKYTGRN